MTTKLLLCLVLVVSIFLNEGSAAEKFQYDDPFNRLQNIDPLAQDDYILRMLCAMHAQELKSLNENLLDLKKGISDRQIFMRVYIKRNIELATFVEQRKPLVSSEQKKFVEQAQMIESRTKIGYTADSKTLDRHIQKFVETHYDELLKIIL